MIKEWIKAFIELPTKEDKRRAGICKACPHAIESDFLQYLNGKIKEVQGLYCNDCKCPLIAKIKTTDKKHICKKWL